MLVPKPLNFHTGVLNLRRSPHGTLARRVRDRFCLDLAAVPWLGFRFLHRSMDLWSPTHQCIFIG